MNKFLAVGVLSLAVLSIIGATTVFADSPTSPAEEGAEVENVEDHKKHREMRKGEQGHSEERLAQAVEEGDLSNAQKEELLEKHEEFKQEMQGSDLSWEERKGKMSNFREEMQGWMEKQGIELGSFGFTEGFEKGGMHSGSGGCSHE